MAVQPLPARDAAALRAAPYSYDRPATGTDETPPGFSRLECSRELRRRDFDGAARDLLTWRMHERAGLRVAASDIPLRSGSVVLMRLGPGPVSLRIPCRVVELIDDSRRRGFAYGTLAGHPEAGEERFLLEQHVDGRIRFTITAVSRPASALATLAGPLSSQLQLLMTRRYLRALDHP